MKRASAPVSRASRNADADVTTYRAVLDAVHARMSAPRIATESRKSPRDIPGLFELLETFSCSGAHGKSGYGPTPEWNPFSQRLLFEVVAPSKHEAIAADFVASTVDRLLLATHEATHVLLWEPFFVGSPQVRSLDAETFADISLSFEGYCFWYADIVVTRRLRARLPDGEFARARSAASQALFHPYRAFEAMGMRDEERILDAYLDAFRGGVSELSQKRARFLVGDLFARFTQMYLEGEPAAKALRRQLVRADIFGEFRRRFASHPGLPTLLPPSVLGMNIAADPADYCREVARKGPPYMAALRAEKLRRVRLRRAIQARAYQTYSLRLACREQRFMNERGAPLSRLGPVIEPHLEVYLDRLNAALTSLCEGRRETDVDRQVAEADVAYEGDVRARFRRARAWVSRRAILYPAIGTRGNALGLLTYSANDLRTISARVVEEARASLLPLGTPTSRILARKLSDLLAVLADDAGKRSAVSAARMRTWTKCIHALLLAPPLLEKWSVELGKISPRENHYREVSFAFA